jgi:hypothetical protein
MNKKIYLYLDFDGVLHHENVLIADNKAPFFKNPKKEGFLFAYADNLASAIDSLNFTDIKIILSTSWVRYKSFSYAKNRLPLSLRNRVIGATFHSQMKYDNPQLDNYQSYSGRRQCDFDSLTRYQSICCDAARRRILDWIAIDDDIHGWPKDKMSKIIATNGEFGLGETCKIDELKHKIFVINTKY